MENGNAVPSIEFQKMSRLFGDTRAVDELSFKVYPGEVFGFIGPNGAGKTTSMRILATLDQPSRGDALVDGLSVVDDPDRVRRRLGFMPDQFGVYSNVTCEEYLDFFARSYGLKGADRRRCLREVMAFTQLDRIAQKPMNGLSKGMKQRLCLSRTLIHNPSVMILDEPAAGLDPRARIELRDMIVALAQMGKTLLISSHILSELAEVCHRVGIIEHGQLLAVGTVEEILQGATTQSRPPRVSGQSESQLNLGRAGKSDQPSKTLRSTVAITVVEDVDRCVQFLQTHHDIQPLKTVGNSVTIAISEDLNEQADLLAELVHAGIRVSSFQAKQRSLEEAFLHVTQGRVQ
jgi:ABC-2 type transport system ATP-binding protein